MKLADPGKLDGAGGRGCIDGVPESLRRFSFSGNGGATSGDATTSPLLAFELPPASNPD